MNFNQYLIKTIKEINLEMEITPEAIETFKKVIDKETYEMAETIIEYRNHKTIMPSDVEFGLRMKRKWGYNHYFKLM